MEEKAVVVEKSSTGLDANIAGVLCYLVGWVSGIIFLLLEKEHKTVKFHAVQSILFSGSITVLYIILSVIQSIMWSLAWHGGAGTLLAVGGLFTAIYALIALGALIVWVVLMVKAYKNETYKLPIFGNIAEKQML